MDFGLDQREATIIEMNPSTYNIRMFARSYVGTSRPSNVLTITTGGTGLLLFFPLLVRNTRLSFSYMFSVEFCL